MSSRNFLRGQLDGLQNFSVARAAAQVSRQGLTDLVSGRTGICVQKSLGGEQNSGNAITALRRAEVGEGVLQRMRFAILRHPFHGDDFGIDCFNAEHQTRKHRRAINQYGASAALPQLATMLGSGETHVLTQDFQQGLVDLRSDFFGLAVDAEAKEDFSWASGCFSAYFSGPFQPAL